MSGFSFMSEERDSDVDVDDSRGTVSGFGFISGNRTESDASQGAGGFMSSLSADELAEMRAQTTAVEQSTHDDTDDENENRQSESGFGFLGGNNNEESEDNEKNETSFSFLSSPTDSQKEDVTLTQKPEVKVENDLSTKQPALSTQLQHDAPSPSSPSLTSNLHSSSPSTQEIKLASSSSTARVVKKKKRTSKVGAQRHMEPEKEFDPPERLPVVNEVTSPTEVVPPTEITPPSPIPTHIDNPPQVEQPVVNSSPESSSKTSTISPSTSQNVVHLADKPTMSSTPPPVQEIHKAHDTMSDISEDNDNSSVGSSKSASSTSKHKSKQKKSRGGFMSYFTKKKDIPVVEERKTVPESSSPPYKPNARASKKLVVENPVQPEISTTKLPVNPTTTDVASNEAQHVWKKPSSPSISSSSQDVPKSSGGNSIPDISVTPSTHAYDKIEEKSTSALSNVKEVIQQSPPSTPKLVQERPPSPQGPKSILVCDDVLCLKIRDLSREVALNFQSSVQDIIAYQNTLLQDMKDSRKKKEKSELKCRQIQQQITDMEVEQNLLAEREEFELADQLSDQLEQLKKEYANNIEIDKQSILAFEDAETSFISCRRELSDKMNEISHGLGNLIRQETEELGNLVKVNTKALTEEDNRVTMEEERITMEMQHVDREESTLQEETAVIENAILSQTSDAQNDKEEMDRELLGVNSEIERLEAELAQKKQEQKMLEMNLLVAEGKIREVRRKFDRQLQRIADRSMTIRAASEECRNDQEAIQSQRSHFNSEKFKLSSMETDINGFIKNMETEKVLAEKLKKTFDSVLMNASPEKISLSGGVSDTSTLRDKVISQETILEKAISSLDATKSSIAALNDEETKLKEKIPNMEAEKKSHASNKRFKEAASVAKEIKAMVARQEEITALILEQEGQIGDKENDITEGKRELDIVLAELTAAERIADVTRFESLISQSLALRVATRNSEKAQLQSDSDCVIASVAAELLSGELKVLLDEAADLKEKHNLDLPLLPELDDDADADADGDNNNEGEVDMNSGDDVVEKAIVEKAVDEEDDKIVEDRSEDTNSQNEVKSDENDVEEPQQETNTDFDESESHEDGKNEVNKEALTSRSQEMMMKIKSLEAELEVAVDTEEYDEAATLSEQVDEMTEELEKMLAVLSLTKKDLEELCNADYSA